MKVENLRPRGAGWTVHAMPCHHAFAEALRAFIDAAGIAEDRKGWLFRTERGHKADALSERAMNQSDAWCMIRRHAAAAGITAEIGCHTFRATGITAYLANGGALEHAQEMAGYESPRGKGVIDAVLDQHAVGADAGLADIPVFRGDRALDRHFDIGVVKDDERRVSAQLE